MVNKDLRANVFHMTNPNDKPSDSPDKDIYEKTKDDKYHPNMDDSNRKLEYNKRLLELRLSKFKEKGKKLTIIRLRKLKKNWGYLKIDVYLQKKETKIQSLLIN